MVTYIVIGSYMSNFTFLASVIVALRWYVSQSVSQYLLLYMYRLLAFVSKIKRSLLSSMAFVSTGAKGDWYFRISDLVKNPVGTYINPCGEFRWSPEGTVSQIHSPHLFVGAPGILSDLLRFVQMLKREWRAESNGKLPHLSNTW